MKGEETEMTGRVETLYDRMEREEAIDPGGSFIVQAPAGSGKTELLIQRFLNLLSVVERPEQILAITFTRKAAGEMRNRIMEAIEKGRAGVSSDSPNEKKTVRLAQAALRRDAQKGWDLMENPGRLKIQTIDSLCALLTRQMPLLSGLGSQPSVSDAPKEFYRVAARRTISLVDDGGKDGDAVCAVLEHLDNSIPELEKRIVMMLERRDQWLRHMKSGVDEGQLMEVIETSLTRVIEDTLKYVRETFPDEITAELVLYAGYAASNLDRQRTEGRIAGLAGLNGLPGSSVNDLQLWQGIRWFLLTDKGSFRKPAGIDKRVGFPAGKTEEAKKNKDGFKELLESLSGNERLQSALAAVDTLPAPTYDGEEAEVLKALIHLLPLADRHLMQIFAEEGKVDFQAIAMAALDALGADEAPTDLMLAIDMKIQHILMDEYQDTSRLQYSLVKAMTRGWEEGYGRTLFIVGDPMQSIYLFRDAEVGLFLDARKNGISSIHLKSLTLRSNFRSQEGIIDWVNEAFSIAFPEWEDIFTGSISYSPFTAVNPLLEGRGVNVRLFDGRDDEGEAEGVIKVIKGVSGRESVAILARSRGHLNVIIEGLKKEGIGFRSQEIDPLAGRPVIQDLLALLRAIIHPLDRIAWLAILRAPWCGLTLSDIHRLCIADTSSSVWSLINDKGRIESLSEDGQRRLLSLRVRVCRAMTMKGRVSPRSLLEGLWIDLGGPACAEDDSTMKDAEIFLEMVDSVSVGGEMGSLKSLQNRIEKLFASHSGIGDNPVEIMTMHKAKGLEFDHVILPGLGKRPRSSARRLLFWMERGDDLLLAPMDKKGGRIEGAIYRYLSESQKNKEALELTRLFYVAATRARKRLYLFGHVRMMEDGEMQMEPGSMLPIIRKRLTPDMIAGKKDNKELSSPPRPSLTLKRLPLSWNRPEPDELVTVKSGRTDTASVAGDIVFSWAGEAVRNLGTVVHRYLCRIANEGILGWSRERIVSERPQIKAILRQSGLNEAEAGKTAEKGIEVLCRAVADERGRWLLGDYPECRAEMPVTGIVNGKIVHAVIDRTFVDGEIRWVVDYKTGLHEGGDLREFLEREKERYEEQLNIYANILASGGEKRKIRMGIYYPALPGWIEWG